MRRLILFGTVLMTLGFSFSPTVEIISEQYRIYWLMLGMAITGVAAAFYHTSLIPYLVESCTERQRSRTFYTGGLSTFCGNLRFLTGIGALVNWHITGTPASLSI